jgi:hypothetical protein
VQGVKSLQWCQRNGKNALTATVISIVMTFAVRVAVGVPNAELWLTNSVMNVDTVSPAVIAMKMRMRMRMR